MSISSFERLSRTVRVEDVCEPSRCIDVIPWELTVGAILRQHAHSTAKDHDPYAPILLRRKQEFDVDGHPIHPAAIPYGVLLPRRAWIDAIENTAGGERYLDYSILDGDSLDVPSSAIAWFTDKNIAAGNVSLWDVLTSDSFALSANGAALVVRGIGDYGVVTMDTLLHRPEAKACWLTATLELEKAALQMCQQRTAESVKALSPERLSKAVERFQERSEGMKEKRSLWLAKLLSKTDIDAYFGKINRDMESNLYSLFLDYTQFADKKTMLLKGAFNLKASKTTIKDVFERAERLRNWCAHPTAECELRIDHLGQLRILIMDIHNLTSELREMTEQLSRG